MLLLVTIGLVLVGAVSLVIGFVSNSLPPIYLSIACSVVAGIVLVVFSRMSKRQEAGGPSSTGFRPAPSAGSWTPPPSPPAPPPAPSYRPPSVPSPVHEPEPAAAPASRASAVAVDDFPIDGYDTLRVSQILPALQDLDLDDLDLVREREEEGKNRTTVLRRIDVLMDERETQDGPAAVAPAGHTTDDDLDGELDDGGLEAEIEDNFVEGMAVDEDDEDYEDEDDFARDIADEEESTAVIPAATASAAGSFPIPGYDRLPVARILPLLDDLDDDELDRVAEYEEKGKNRTAILDRIDDMFEPVEDEAPAPIPAPPAPAPAKKTMAKKADTKKAPAKRAPAKKTPAKKTMAKKAGAEKAAVAKKVTPVKAGPAKKAAVEKAAVGKAAPVKRPSPVTRTATKKAAPAKRPPAPAKKVVKKR